jgi:hypothetical protein
MAKIYLAFLINRLNLFPFYCTSNPKLKAVDQLKKSFIHLIYQSFDGFDATMFYMGIE